ncbi:hypothetical protein PTSG_00734 [Salpingoeca rosetta]|uniref:RRM domain-containing protein n=1 Tax=Salpingoeca rosetta (strain ATCC 50818 / BSB-021) TaxID=946362 RepID=F2TXB5_SALR5|nr:uncharacterized protein PTSG_00734 [Salpingoeca rosetta]EGD76024.1 hypothetical protein PTSG_00734 [Salpingoeca rosetta]|eukprot:XP_004998199.1 hypothetical protein PTSG_00734 [Salpingoeca rosetta]
MPANTAESDTAAVVTVPPPTTATTGVPPPAQEKVAPPPATSSVPPPPPLSHPVSVPANGSVQPPPAATNGTVRPHKQRTSSSREAEAEAMKRRVFVGNIGRQCTEEDIRRLVGDQFGRIESINIVRDHVNHQSKGYGFIAFSTEEEANRCIALAEQHPIHFRSRQLNFREARRRERGSSDPPRRRMRQRSRGASLDASMHTMYPHMMMPDPNGGMMPPMEMQMYENGGVMPMYMHMQQGYPMPNAPLMGHHHPHAGRAGLVGPPPPNSAPYSPVYAHPTMYSQHQPDTHFAFSGMMPYAPEQQAPTRYQQAFPGQRPPPVGIVPGHTHGHAAVDDATQAMAGMNLGGHPQPPQQN